MSDSGIWPHTCIRKASKAFPAALVMMAACAVALPLHGTATASEPIATFSIVGYDPATGDLGVAVQSKFFAVGSVVPWARANVGAVASQAYGNTTFGPLGLAMLEEGMSVEAAMESLLAHDSDAAQRQVGMVDAGGNSHAYTGDECMDWAGHESGPNFTAQGNILVSGKTVDAMARAFGESGGILGEKLMRALEAGQAAGGDSRGMQSAAILIVREGGGYGGYNDVYCDLRVDDHEDPIAELRRIFDMWKEWALVLEGYRLCEEENWERAFEAGRAAVELNPELGEPYYHLACYYSKAGMRDEALRELGTAVGLDKSLGPRARLDTDFEPLREDPEFLDITGE
ncbi:MAG: DUF1028 domain-containing protein [Candidatus Eisenbacteria bacterium]